jgi:hypothetical protein
VDFASCFRGRNPGRFLRWSWLLLFLLGLFAPDAAHAQESGILSGLVVNSWDGRPLPGVVVTIRGTILAGTTDASGRYRIEGVPAGEHSVRFSKSGFAMATATGVRVAPGLVRDLPGSLRPEFYEMEEYEVTAEQFQVEAIEIIEQRQASTSFLDAISSDQFKRLGATDAAQIINKLPGTTVVEGKFAVIRGLSDRYNITQLNGAQIPTADPYRQGAPLDIIPASMIQEVSVSKTFTPDLPGGFAGGLANLVTKSFPDKFILQIEVGLEYNSQSTFNDNFLTYPGSPTDWAGFGKSTRELPSVLDGQTGATLRRPVRAPPNQTPAQAQERQEQADKLQTALGSFQDYTFAGTEKAPPPNYGGNFSVGETIDVNGHNFGYFVSGVYRRRWLFYDDGIQGRYRPIGIETLGAYRKFQDTRAVMEATWASIVNLAYELVPEDHSVSFTFYWNQNGEDTTRRQVGTIEDFEQVVDLNTLQWIQRQVHAFQMRGDDRFEDFHDLNTDWLVSIVNTTQDEPDLRYFNYAYQPDGSEPVFSNSIPEPIAPTRFYRNINEDSIWAALNNQIPFQQWDDLESFVKFGGAFSGSQRQFQEQTFQFSTQDTSGWGQPPTPNNYFTPENIRYTTQVNARGTNYIFQRWFLEGISPAFYNGQQQIPAGYTMVELPVTERLKFVGGARVENTYLSVTGEGGAAGSTNSLIDQLDVMPAISSAFTIITNMNLRASFSQTVARPSYRELAPYRSYDTVGDEIIEGNPGLQMTQIDNYDLRWEWFPQPSAVLSVSGFYKYLKDPIEKVALTFGGGIVTFENREEATLYGVEFEANSKLDVFDESLEEFIVGFNFAYIKSQVDLTPTELVNERVLFPNASATRPLFDQSPWIVNFDLTYDHKSSGTTATVSLGAAGPYVAIVDRGGPDVYEFPPMQLNFIVTQRLSDHWRMRFSARNLLNQDQVRSYGEESGGPIFSSFSIGVALGVTLTYEY